MSDAENEVPQLDPESKSFLARHQQTGEPSAEALERGLRRLSAPVPSGTPKPASVTRLPRARRPILPPEAMAAAAVVVLLLGAQGLYLALRRPEVTSMIPEKAEVKPTELGPRAADPELQAVAEAWRAGDFESARRLAARECKSEACGSLRSELAQMLGLAQQVETLSDDQRAQLASFDKKLSDGRDSALKRRLEKRISNRAPEADSAEALARAEKLFEQAKESKRLKNPEAAVVQLEECVKTAPSYPPCYRLLGSVYALLASRDGSAADMERARNAYQQFLAVAPVNDEYVPKVTAILDAANAPPSPDAVEQAAPINLVVGGHATLTVTKDIARVAIGDSAIADIRTMGARDLRVEGVKAGRTTVLLWYQDGSRLNVTISVTEPTDLDSRVGKLIDEVTQARAKGNYQRAYKNLQLVLQLEPGNQEALRIQSDLQREAEETYHRAYVIRDVNPAEALFLFKRVIDMTPADSATHQKAKSLVSKLE